LFVRKTVGKSKREKIGEKEKKGGDVSGCDVVRAGRFFVFITVDDPGVWLAAKKNVRRSGSR